MVEETREALRMGKIIEEKIFESDDQKNFVCNWCGEELPIRLLASTYVDHKSICEFCHAHD